MTRRHVIQLTMYQQPRPPIGWSPARSIDYDTVVVHHISPVSIIELRTRPEYVCALARVARINRLLGLGVRSANGIMSGDFGARRMEACESSH
jgi:hypothetical protein